MLALRTSIFAIRHTKTMKDTSIRLTYANPNNRFVSQLVAVYETHQNRNEMTYNDSIVSTSIKDVDSVTLEYYCDDEAEMSYRVTERKNTRSSRQKYNNHFLYFTASQDCIGNIIYCFRSMSM